MATVSARVPDKLKQKISEEKISLSKVIREALEEELKKRRREKIKNEAEDLNSQMEEKIDNEDIVESLREDRNR